MPDIAEDARGQIWVATGGGGIYVQEGEEWRRVGPDCGVSASRIYSLLIDREDRLWVGTHLGGVCLSQGRASEL
jgi:ligand-binding sensor domain-containing protein